MKVPRLMALNVFPNTTGYPKIYFTPITKIDIGDYASVIASLFNSGALTYDLGLETENAVRREVGLPEITEPGLIFKQATTVSGNPETLETMESSKDEDKEKSDEGAKKEVEDEGEEEEES